MIDLARANFCIILSRHYDGLKDYPIQYVIAMARLGHKYQFDLLEKFARQRIKSIFPVTLAEWKSSTISEVNSELYASIAEYQFDLISIAIKIHLRTVLPCMYLMCIWDLESAVRADYPLLLTSNSAKISTDLSSF